MINKLLGWIGTVAIAGSLTAGIWLAPHAAASEPTHHVKVLTSIITVDDPDPYDDPDNDWQDEAAGRHGGGGHHGGGHHGRSKQNAGHRQ